MKGRTANFIWYLAGLLLFLTMLSTHLLGGVYARYTATGSGSDAARVAAFRVDVTAEEVNAVCTESQDGTYTLTVTNDSEVAVAYTISARPGAETEIALVLTSPEGLTGTLAPGAAQTRTLTFAPEDWSQVTKGASGSSLTFTLDVPWHICVDIRQID